MQNDQIVEKLHTFTEENKVTTKGPLSVVLVLTHNAREYPIPLEKAWFVTENEGQVKGLGKNAVCSILKDHGIDKVLAEEGGRTSRGSLGLMNKYISFLNDNITSKDQLEFIEKYWIERVQLFFQGKPIKANLERSKTIASFVKNLIQQAEKKQKDNPGTQYVGTLYQHLVGAKLRLILGNEAVKCHGSSVADSPTDRSGDFLIQDTSIHVTTFPQEALIRKCQRNIESSLKPIIVTSSRGIPICEGLLQQNDIDEKVDVYELSQFISINMNEIGLFSSDKIKETVEQLIEKYNQIINETETDPSLLIKI